MKILFVISFLLAEICSFAMPAQVILIRHGEKPDTGGDLNAQGYARANALPVFFKNNPDVNQMGPVAVIFAMAQAGPGSSNRAVETVKPTADALNIKLKTNFTKDQTAELANEIKNNSAYDGKTLVVCWEHKMIPIIATQLGLKTGPQSWDGSVFDRAWILRFQADGSITYRNIGEHVLPGDST